jgi:GT2 family glycosyltransferase
MASDPSVGAVLVNFNGLRFLPDCVRSLKADGYPQLEIVIVDNASTDASIESVIAEHPDVTVLRQSTNLGFAKGTNVGIRHVLERGHEYVLLLNNDTRVDAGFVSALVSVADRRTLVAPKSYEWHSGATVNSHVGELDWLKGRLRERYFARPDDLDSSRLQEVELADGACLLVPADVFRQVGLLDEAFYMYYEDWDFVVRARHHGHRVLFQPLATMRHHERGTTGPTNASAISAYYTTRNRLRFMKKHRGRRWSFLPFLVWFAATRSLVVTGHVLGGRWHLARWTVVGILDFVRGRTGRADGPHRASLYPRRIVAAAETSGTSGCSRP